MIRRARQCSHIFRQKNESFSNYGLGARFSKVPRLNEPFSGVTNPFVSQERRGFKSSNFTLIFLFVTLKTG